MVEVSVKLLGALKGFSEGKALHLHLDGESRMDDLVQCLVTNLGPVFEKVFLDPIVHNPLPRALILMGGFEIGVLQGMETPLRDGDEVVILPISHGG